jgi:hypothetical protein
MAEQEMVTAKDGVWKMDVDTFIPEPEGHILVKGVEYPIYSFLDIEIGDSFKVARLAEDINKSEDYEERMSRSIEQILLLNSKAKAAGRPVLTPEHFAQMTARELITITVLASSVARVPLKAGSKNPSGDNSPSPSPESAVSSDGGERISSPSA